MNKVIRNSAALAVVSLVAFVLAVIPPYTLAKSAPQITSNIQTPSALPWLKTMNGQIVRIDNNERVELRGVNVLRNEWVYPDMSYERLAIPQLANVWHANLITHGFASAPVVAGDATYLAVLDEYQQLAEQNNMYIIFVYYYPTLNGDQPPNPDVDPNSQQALVDLVQRYRNKSNVMFMLQAEPHSDTWNGQYYHVTWNTLRPSYDRMILAMRAVDNPTPNKHLILASGDGYGRDISPVVVDEYGIGYLDPIRAEGGENIVYSSHPYDHYYTTNNWDYFLPVADAGYPVLVTEFGTGGQMDQADTELLMTLMNDGTRHISWTAWIFDNEGCPCLLTGPRTNFTPSSPYGVSVEDRILAEATNFNGGGPTSTPTRTPAAVTPTVTRTATRTSTSTRTATRTSTPTNTQTSIPTNTPTRTNTATDTPSNTPTNSPTNTPTNTPTNSPTFTVTSTPTNTSTTAPTQTPGGPTATDIPPSDTPTNTPTNTTTSTSTNTPTNTPTNMPTNTPTSTSTNIPTNTYTRTNTPTRTLVPTDTPTIPPTQTQGGPSATPIPSDTDTPSPMPSNTNTPLPVPTDTVLPGSTDTATPISCLLQFADIATGNTFYPFVRCLACQGIINGYTCGGDGEPCNDNNDPYFRPQNTVTRGQIAKIVSNSLGLADPMPGQTFQDVTPNSTFDQYIERLASRGVISGYACGGPGEPCVGPENRPYFRPNGNTTRGQLSKIVCRAYGCAGTVQNESFEDVLPASTFYTDIERLYALGAITGYACGGPGEPCGPGNKPYFRPGNNITRGQTTKIVSTTFFPGCGSALRQ